ncbi:MAG: T9SS type A sorting domain-containing protein, partial [Sphingomonadales bacterium]
LHCYPNPSNGRFTIETTQGFKVLRVFDLSGKVIFETSNHYFSKYEIDLGSQKNGLYLIEVSFENGQFMRNKLLIGK